MDALKRQPSARIALMPGATNTPAHCVVQPRNQDGAVRKALEGLGVVKREPRSPSTNIQSSPASIPEKYRGTDGILLASRDNNLSVLTDLLQGENRAIGVNYRDPRTGETAWGIAVHTDNHKMIALLKPALDAAPRGIKNSDFGDARGNAAMRATSVPPEADTVNESRQPALPPSEIENSVSPKKEAPLAECAHEATSDIAVKTAPTELLPLPPSTGVVPANTVNAARPTALTAQNVRSSEYYHTNYNTYLNERFLPKPGMFLFADHNGIDFKFIYRNQYNYVNEFVVSRAPGEKVTARSNMGSLEMNNLRHLMEKALENTPQQGVAAPKRAVPEPAVNTLEIDWDSDSAEE
jgi:hypothetical protein